METVNWTSIFLFVAGLVVSFLAAVSKYLFDKVSDHEKRIQKIEDIQGNKLDVLSLEFKEFKHDINEKLETLKDMVHKNRNLENQMSTMLSILVKRHARDTKNEDD